LHRIHELWFRYLARDGSRAEVLQSASIRYAAMEPETRFVKRFWLPA
jgi:hypothetical protein